MTITSDFDRWAILQVRIEDREVESVIAKFQHEALANHFLAAIKPGLSGHSLELVELDDE